MGEIVLIRHGQTEWSANGRHTSVTDLPLTDRGEQQAKLLIGHLEPSDFGLVLSSPRRRARDTARLAGFTGRHEPQLDEDLAEWAYGEYEGRTSAEIQEEVPGWTIWSHAAPGGETADQVSTRLDRVVERVRSSGVERAICFPTATACGRSPCAGWASTSPSACTSRWTPARSRCWARRRACRHSSGGTPGPEPHLAGRPGGAQS